MKKTKKIIALLLTLVMTMALGITAFAAGTGTITVNNIQAGNTYTIYKVFDGDSNATGAISYKVMVGKENKELPEGFTLDAGGNVIHEGTATELTADEIASIAQYIAGDDAVDTKVVDADETATSITFAGLANGYYYITTTTGAAVTIDSANPNAEVEDKNEAPGLDKTITDVGGESLDADGKNAIAQIGTVVEYEARIEVKNGAMGYVFHDKMDAGLTYNNDVAVYVGDDKVDPSTDAVKTFETTPKGDDTITVTFDNDWIKTKVDETIVIKYSATVNENAVTVAGNKNTASIDYGDDNTIELQNIPVVYTATYTVTKVDGTGAALAGAGFVISRDDEGTTEYYYYDETNNTVSWVEGIDNATEYTTEVNGDEAKIVFKGLASGTYTLIEKTVPAGYNKAEDVEFTIKAVAEENATVAANLSQSTTVTNNTGTELPSTGGMGTTMFYIIGGILVIGAGILLVVRRRMRGTR